MKNVAKVNGTSTNEWDRKSSREELSKCIEGLKREREELVYEIEKETADREELEAQLEDIQQQLEENSFSLSIKIQTKSELDTTIMETETAFVRLTESAQHLLDALKAQQKRFSEFKQKR
ncbi:conserved Plasmodium protein, unknown function [Babesia microti strain RI]|uniref:Uncharacterized protein n=1 Tax=Babesia microti (strain RI) TaxID=1133968 RepID=A0A0K3ASQ0_BABMR|nr:conserved Plasmodium protein, unknown function [Babesia microti strain RI]CTQ41485.1 conserved Plasmodium protein, unknown function [Babesia microti strain RI]|eukprot:XP_012649496.1 conserved Plasmodium protein, unknown function [Babesia microti strain RI]